MLRGRARCTHKAFGSLHRRGGSGVLARREHVSCTTALLGSWACYGPLRLPAAKSSNEGRTLQASARRLRRGRRPGLAMSCAGVGLGERLRGQFRYRQLDQASSEDARSRRPAGVHGARKIALHPQPHSSIPHAQGWPRCGVVLQNWPA
jgi:hypothetical protein